MQRTLALDDRSFSVVQATVESFCLVCEVPLQVNSSTNIFYASLPRNGELLASFVLRVLRPVSSDLRSSYICLRCNELFQMLEQAQWTVSNIRSEILKVYHSREGEKDAVRKANVLQSRMFPDDLFTETEQKTVFDGDRFHQISGFRTQDVQNNGNSTRISTFDNTPSEFCNFNIHIQNGEKMDESAEIIENGVCENKINDVAVPNEAGSDETIVQSNVFKNSANDFCRQNIGADSCIKKLKKPLEMCQLSVYEGKYDSLQIEEPIAITDEKEAENKSKNCSMNTPDLVENMSNDLSNNSVNGRPERSTKDDEIQDTVQCKICPRPSENSSDLRSYCLKHRVLYPYQCCECDERFVDLSMANTHATLMHSSLKNCISIAAEPWNNETLNFNDDNSIILKESKINKNLEINNKKDEQGLHESRNVPKYRLKPLKYSCSTCGKKWRTSAELKTHINSHSNLRPYMCEKCGQAYKHKHALEIHVGMHNGISPYQCNVCNKCFTQKGALLRHLPLHTGEMPYQCELCGKRFVHHTSYNMHALSHTGKKSYQCHVCDLSLLSTSHLKRHMRVHTGEKPYSCELCGKNFAERYNLFAHQKIHDPVEIMAKAAKKITHKCGQCDEFFDKKQKLDDHAKERHSSVTNGRNWIDRTVDTGNMAAKTSESLVDKL